ncbi:MAG: ClpXP protease specificity-enhancing factor [Gammaproteobacteria bacterium]
MAARQDDDGTAKPSTRPYLMRAIYEWALDHGLTPQMLVDAGIEGMVLPDNFAGDKRITLTIHPRAVKGLEMDNDFVRFSARFGGQPHHVLVPVVAVLGIYARENGHGMFFYSDSDDPPPDAPKAKSGKAYTPPSAPPRLKLVK